MRPRTRIFRNRLLSSVKIAPIAMLGGLALGAFPLAVGHAEDAKVEDVVVSGSGADNPNKLTRDDKATKSPARGADHLPATMAASMTSV